jgi:hypothetical protein
MVRDESFYTTLKIREFYLIVTILNTKKKIDMWECNHRFIKWITILQAIVSGDSGTRNAIKNKPK